MKRPMEVIWVAAIAVLIMGGTCSPQGSAHLVSWRAAGRPAIEQGEAVAIPGAFGRPAFSPDALRRAVVEREWHEGLRERCASPSPFAVPSPVGPAC